LTDGANAARAGIVLARLLVLVGERDWGWGIFHRNSSPRKPFNPADFKGFWPDAPDATALSFFDSLQPY
jgi:hypothetical protein